MTKLEYENPAFGDAFLYFFRYKQAGRHTEYLPHIHRWGQVVFVRQNVLEMHVEGKRLLTPPECPVWVPPQVEHTSYNRKEASLRTFNISASLCEGFPPEACVLETGAIVRAIVDHCAERELERPSTPEDERLCAVLCDQLRHAPRRATYLAQSDDKLLAPVLQALEENPGDKRTLAQWAELVFTTERTLARRFQQQLRMSFGEWRQRLRYLHAIGCLERGLSVQAIADNLGYSSSSAFIVMFHQQTGLTPEQYRQQR